MQTLFLLSVFAVPPPPVSTLERDLERLRPTPAAEIEESSDRDPVQPPPRPPRKGKPDGRAVAYHPVYDHPRARGHLERAALTGRPVEITGTEDDRPVLWTFNPDGTIDRTRQAIVATGPAPPPVIPGPPPVNYMAPPLNAQPMPARSVPSVQPFRGGLDFNPSHTCQRCGREVLRIAGPGPTPGTHRHRCPCGNSWFH